MEKKYTRIYKNKAFFAWTKTIDYWALYMAQTWWDFQIELTMTYRKKYKWEYWSNYQDIVDWNLEDWNLDNLQIYYVWKEWWKFKNKSLLERFLYYTNNFTKEELKDMYIKRINE